MPDLETDAKKEILAEKAWTKLILSETEKNKSPYLTNF